MRHVSRTLSLLGRPQLWVGILAFCALLIGLQQISPKVPYAPLVDLPSGTPHVVQQFASPQPRPPIPPVDCSHQACLALTFDDGPNPVTTPQVLDVLARHHARATFFVIGSHVPGNEALLRRMYHDGHEIGNHSWSHPDFTTLSPEQIRQQISQTQAVVVAAGVPAPTLFRPPYGAVNAVVKSQVPMTFAMWNIDPEDWRAKHPKDVLAKMEPSIRPGRVVDLHDIHQPTADSLDQMVTNLQQQYQLVTFSELFDLTSGQPGLFYGR